VSRGPVRFTLDSGETLTVEEKDVPRIYELLWQLAPQPGAVTTAAALHTTFRQSEFSRPTIALTAAQSAMLRRAISLLEDDPP